MVRDQMCTSVGIGITRCGPPYLTVIVKGEHGQCCVVIYLKGNSNLKGKRSSKNSQPKYSLLAAPYSVLVWISNGV